MGILVNTEIQTNEIRTKFSEILATKKGVFAYTIQFHYHTNTTICLHKTAKH